MVSDVPVNSESTSGRVGREAGNGPPSKSKCMVVEERCMGAGFGIANDVVSCILFSDLKAVFIEWLLNRCVEAVVPL